MQWYNVRTERNGRRLCSAPLDLCVCRLLCMCLTRMSFNPVTLPNTSCADSAWTKWKLRSENHISRSSATIQHESSKKCSQGTEFITTRSQCQAIKISMESKFIYEPHSLLRYLQHLDNKHCIANASGEIQTLSWYLFEFHTEQTSTSHQSAAHRPLFWLSPVRAAWESTEKSTVAAQDRALHDLRIPDAQDVGKLPEQKKNHALMPCFVCCVLLWCLDWTPQASSPIPVQAVLHLLRMEVSQVDLPWCCAKIGSIIISRWRNASANEYPQLCGSGCCILRSGCRRHQQQQVSCQDFRHMNAALLKAWIWLVPFPPPPFTPITNMGTVQNPRHGFKSGKNKTRCSPQTRMQSHKTLPSNKLFKQSCRQAEWQYLFSRAMLYF